MDIADEEAEMQKAAKAHCMASGSGRRSYSDRRAKTAEEQVAILQRLMEAQRVYHERMMKVDTRTIWTWRFVSLFLFIGYWIF